VKQIKRSGSVLLGAIWTAGAVRSKVSCGMADVELTVETREARQPRMEKL
jgi:hypothetical protein